MKYTIGYLLNGKTKKYTENLMKKTANISNERYVVDVNKVPPHITMKSHFEFNDYKKLDEFLKEFTAKRKKAKIKIIGFDYFRGFFSLKFNFYKEAKKIRKALVKELDNKIGIKPIENDLKYKPHATICFSNTKKTFNIIWDYLKKQKKPKFDLELDNIILFYKPKNRWKIKKRFELK